MVTPMPWLERVPSYKEQREQITDKDLGNVGFFLYPLLQAADITIVLADAVPVGEDQLPHLELTREIVRRFNNTYGEYLVEPKAIIAKAGRARARHRRPQDVEELRQRDLHLGPARRDARQGHVVHDRPRAQAQDRSRRPGHLPAAPGPQAHRARRARSPSWTAAAAPPSAAASRTRRSSPRTSSPTSRLPGPPRRARRHPGLRLGGPRRRRREGAPGHERGRRDLPRARRHRRPHRARRPVSSRATDAIATIRTVVRRRRARPGGRPWRYTVKTDVFEGPFDLLLHLVSRQKLDVGAISISDVADQYLEHIDRMADLDLDVASDFLLVAATLLEIKAASLLPKEEPYFGDELDDLSPEEARDILVARLLAYKQFKNAAGELAARMEAEDRMHPRQAGLEQRVPRADARLPRGPDAARARRHLRRPDAPPRGLPARGRARRVDADLARAARRERAPAAGAPAAACASASCVDGDATPEIVVVTLLAILELYKRGRADITQDELFGEIVITHIDDEEAARRGLPDREDD